MDPPTSTRADGVDPHTSTRADGVDPPTDPSQLTTLDEYVDMDNDVDDWVEDGADAANNTTEEQIKGCV